MKKCPKCKISFKTNYALRIHIQLYHPQILNELMKNMNKPKWKMSQKQWKTLHPLVTQQETHDFFQRLAELIYKTKLEPLGW